MHSTAAASLVVLQHLWNQFPAMVEVCWRTEQSDSAISASVAGFLRLKLSVEVVHWRTSRGTRYKTSSVSISISEIWLWENKSMNNPDEKCGISLLGLGRD